MEKARQKKEQLSTEELFPQTVGSLFQSHLDDVILKLLSQTIRNKTLQAVYFVRPTKLHLANIKRIQIQTNVARGLLHHLVFNLKKFLKKTLLKRYNSEQDVIPTLLQCQFILLK